MKIAVTGASGFIGSILVPRLKAAEHEVVTIDIAADSNQDVRNQKILNEMFEGCDAIIHLAALIGARDSSEFEAFHGTNVMGSWNVVKAAKVARVPKIVFASSAAVRTLRSYYATSKALSETLVRGVSRQTGIDFVGLRLFNVYGPTQTTEHGALIPMVIQDIQKGRATTVHSTGQQTRDFVFVDDVAQCFLQAAERQERFNGLCFDVGTGWATRVLTLIRKLYDVADKQPHIKFERMHRDSVIMHSRADPAMCGERLGMRDYVALDDGLARVWNSG